MKFYILVFIMCVSLSCTKKPKSIFDFQSNQKPTFDLKSTKIIIPELLIPFKIERKDSFLIIQESSRIPPNQSPIHIINQSNLSYYMAKGVIGYGPNEISDAHVYDPGFFDSTFWVNSVINKRMVEFSLYNNSKHSISEFRQPASMQLVTRLLFSSNNSFIGHVSSDAYDFVEFDKNGNRINGYGLKEPIDRKGIINDGSSLNNFIIAQVNKGLFKRDPFKDIYVKASLYTDRIDIFDYKSKTITRLQGPRLEVPDFQIVGSGVDASPAFPIELAYGHRDICFGKQYIYDLYGGYNQKDFQTTGRLAETIYILTKKGEMIARLTLDKSVISIAVDEDLGKIYGITTDENPGIAVFDIPKELLNK